MRILALDLSKRSTGFAIWGRADARALIGHWVLGSEITDDGTACGRLHEQMSDLCSVVGSIDAVFMEETIDARALSGHTNIETLKILSYLAGHAKSWAACYPADRPRIIREVNMTRWRRHFLGSMKRGTKSTDLKEYAMLRAREYGFNPRRHDEAEALGILDYACDDIGVVPPWRESRPLVQQFGRSPR